MPAAAGLGGAVAPVPASDAVCGPAGAVSVIVNAAARAPAAAGVNTTDRMQVAPGVTVVPVQPSPLMANSVALAPVMTALATESAPLPVLVSVIVWVAAAVPTGVSANVAVAGANEMPGTGTTPDPDTATE